MKKTLLFGIWTAALVGSPAFAADMPVKAPPAPALAPYNWGGFYIGGNVGYSWGRIDTDVNAANLAQFGFTTFSQSLNSNGVIGGGQIGYNWQFDKWVFGLETDFQGSAEKNSVTRNPFNVSAPIPGIVPPIIGLATFNQTLEAKIEWFGTVRGRLGLLLTPAVLLYGTGGLAYGRIEADSFATLTTSFGGIPLLTSASSISDSKTKFGWTLGGGIEGTIPSTRDWTWKVEYLYIDLGSINTAGRDPALGAFGVRTNVTDNIVRAGLNYRFR